MQGVCFATTLTHSDADWFNRQTPNAHYRLNLAASAERCVATELVELWKQHGPASWRDSTLNGEPFQLTPELDWPTQMPTSGELVLNFEHEAPPAATAVSVTDAELQPILDQLRSLHTNDIWRLTLTRILTTTFFFTARQASQARPLWKGQCQN